MESKLFNSILSSPQHILYQYYSLKRILVTDTCGNVLITVLCLQVTIILSRRNFYTECYLWLFNVFFRTSTLYALCCYGLRLSFLNKETTYLLNIRYLLSVCSLHQQVQLQWVLHAAPARPSRQDLRLAAALFDRGLSLTDYITSVLCLFFHIMTGLLLCRLVFTAAIYVI